MTTRRSIVRRDRAQADDLAVEEPLVLALDGAGSGSEVLATLMRTPGHDLELAAGWLCAESEVYRPEHVVSLRECRSGDGGRRAGGFGEGRSSDGPGGEADVARVRVRLAAGVEPPRPRAFVTGAACGVCSADVLDLGLRRRSAPSSAGWSVARDVLAGLPDAMRVHQRAFERTGGLHAATLARADGELLGVREDVGRHNAVDKVVGRALLNGLLPATDLLLVVSGRVSFEIVQKAVAAGAAGIVAVSAPSSLAVDLARDHDLLLAGMVRDGSFNVYSGEELVSGSKEQDDRAAVR